MNKKPPIFKNNIKGKSNNKQYCKVSNKEDIMNIINNLFKGPSTKYNTKVSIKTPVKEIETYIYQQTEEELVTIQNERIPIEDIISIKRIS